MSFLNLSVELGKTNVLLERIANALEAAVGPAFLPKNGTYKKRGSESIRTYGNNERLWLKDNFANTIREKGLAPAVEQEILDEALMEYDQSVESQALGESDL